jgi:hypothetical protein
MTENAPSLRYPSRLKGWEWLLITAILLGGFALRTTRFLEVPPGVIHDEVLDWFNVQMIYDGEVRATPLPALGTSNRLILIAGLAALVLLLLTAFLLSG